MSTYFFCGIGFHIFIGGVQHGERALPSTGVVTGFSVNLGLGPQGPGGGQGHQTCSHCLAQALGSCRTWPG